MLAIVFLSTAGAVALLELPSLRRRRLFGEFWAVVAILACGVLVTFLEAANVEMPSAMQLITRLIRPFGQMMVGN